MKTMTGRERITRIFQGKEVDRPSLKLWGFYPGQELLHPAYEPVVQKAAELTDWFLPGPSPFDMVCGVNRENIVRTEVRPVSDLWNEHIISYETPLGKLQEKHLVSTVRAPGYITEHAVKTPEDMEKLLSIPYKPFPLDLERYQRADEAAGDHGIALFDLDHAAYALQRLMGSELLALFSIDHRELLDRTIAVFSGRIISHARTAIEAGLKGIFSWVGPELFIPPLMAPGDFEDFAFKYDKPLCDMIHNSGGYVWMHCHGKVANFIDRFIEMGIDVINPLEPPKNGDVNLRLAAKKFKGRIGLEGNIEIQEIIQAEPEHLRQTIRSCVEAGKPSGRFILCPSAGYMEYPFPEPEYIRNLLIYLEEGFQMVKNT
ncbi:hypothetical protein FACS189447_09760 [Spirochaetia bacterium]|nr:hypothetical protein FACS189447_09760 [Spirochaetia bacterium]